MGLLPVVPVYRVGAEIVIIRLLEGVGSLSKFNTKINENVAGSVPGAVSKQTSKAPS